jgi:hypothetical protein
VEHARRRRWLLALAVVALLAEMAVAMVTSAREQTPTIDEPVYMGAATVYVQQHSLRYNTEHPPLGKLIIGSGLAFAHPRLDPAFVGSEQAVGRHLLYESGNDARRLTLLARLPMIVLTLLFGLVVFAFARDLVGPIGGLVALALYAFSPDLIAHGSLATLDVAAAGFLLTSVWLVWRARRRPLPYLPLAGLALGAALATKMSALPAVPVLVLLAVLSVWCAAPPRRALYCAAAAAGVALLAVGVVWAAYVAVDPRLRWAAPENLPVVHGLRGLAVDWLPFPRPYRDGMRIQFGFEDATWFGFLFGRQYLGSLWYYLPAALLVKTPLGMLALWLAGAVAMIAVPRLRSAAPYVLIPTAVLLAAAMTGSRDLGVRYAIFVPMFLAVAAAGVLAVRWRWVPAMTAVLLLYVAVSSLRTYPYYLPYSNEAFGGPAATYRHLHDSNVDWGQDLGRLADHLRQRYPGERVWLVYKGSGVPSYYGINAPDPRGVPPNQVHGLLVVSDSWIDKADARLRALIDAAEPIDEVGHSITIYRRLSKSPQEAVAEGVHPPDRSARSGPQAVLPAPAGNPVQDGRVVGDDRDRHVVADAAPGDDRRGLVVAEEDEYEVVVAVGLHVGDEGVQRVLDGTSVRGAYPVRVAPHGLRLVAGLRHAVEGRAVAHLVPGDHARGGRPGRVARDQRNLRHHRRVARLRQLRVLELRQGVLVGRHAPVEARAAISHGPAVVGLVVAVERALRPRAGGARHDGDRPPARVPEGTREGQAVGLDQAVVPPLVVDPQAGQQRGVGQPAAAARRRRGEEAAPGAVPGRAQPTGSGVEHGVDLRREPGALDRDAPIALHEREDHVLAAQAGEQPIARDAPEGVDGGLPGERLLIRQARTYLTQPAVRLGGDRHPRDELRAEHGTGHPGDAEHAGGAGRRGLVAYHDTGQPQHRQRHEDQQRDGEHSGPDQDGDRTDPSDRGREKLQPVTDEGPIEDHVERPTENREEAQVENLDDGQQTQGHAGQRRDHSPRPRRQDEDKGDAEQSLQRDAHERRGREAIDVVRCDEGEQHEQAGQDGGQPRGDPALSPRNAGIVRRLRVFPRWRLALTREERQFSGPSARRLVMWVNAARFYIRGVVDGGSTPWGKEG